MKVIFEVVRSCLVSLFITLSLFMVVLPSPTCNGHPPSGWLIVLLVSTMATGMPFDAPAA